MTFATSSVPCTMIGAIGVGEQVPEDDPAVAIAERARRLAELFLAQRLRNEARTSRATEPATRGRR